MNGIIVSDKEVEKIVGYIKAHKPIAYENLLEEYPKATFVLTMLEETGVVDEDEVFFDDMATSVAMEIVIFRTLGMNHPLERNVMKGRAA